MNFYRTVQEPEPKSLVANKVTDKASQVSDDWFESVFNTYWQRICALLFHLVGDRAEAEDLALEVFWRFHQRPPETKDHHKLGGWLYRVATNLGFNALRSRKRRQRYEEEAGYLEIDANTLTNPVEASEQEEVRQRVRQTLAQMKPRDARLLILRHSGLSYAELAAVVRLAPASIGTLLVRAEREFEKLYQEAEKRH
jgi:RNA polymerase sigma-70 factor (ECF subfamily)